MLIKIEGWREQQAVDQIALFYNKPVSNAAYEPQVYDPREVVVQGKLAGLLRRYN